MFQRLLVLVLTVLTLGLAIPMSAHAAMTEGQTRLGLTGWDGENDIGPVEAFMEAGYGGNWSWKWQYPSYKAYTYEGWQTDQARCQNVIFYPAEPGVGSPNGTPRAGTLGSGVIVRFYGAYLAANGNTPYADGQTKPVDSLGRYFIPNSFWFCTSIGEYPTG